MTTPTLDRDRLRELFDLRSSYNEYTGGTYHDDPYPVWHRLREQGPVLPGILHELTGCTAPLLLPRAAVSRPAPLHGVRLRHLHDRLPQSGGVRLVAGARSTSTAVHWV